MKTMLVAFLIALPTFALADVKTQVAQIDSALGTCLTQNQSTIGMKTCLQTAFGAVNTLLNVTYSSLVEGLAKQGGNAEFIRRIQAAEKAWIVYRDTDARMQAAVMLGGTGEGVIYGQAIYESEKARTLQLDSLNRQLQ